MERYRYIDSLRAIAALSVIYFHMSMTMLHQDVNTFPFEKTMYEFISQYFNLGKIAVILFFAISGFVVPFTLLKARKKPIASFIISRLFRLYPAYWLSIPFGLLCFYFLADKAVTLKLVAVNSLMLQQFVGVDNIIGLYWTLQIELIFYVCCVVMFQMRLLQDNRAVFLAAIVNIGFAIILAVARYYLNMKLPVALPLSLSVMFWGILWRKALLNEMHEAKRLAWIFLAVFISAIPIISLLAYNHDMGFGETWYNYTIAYITAVAVFVVFTRYIKIQSPVLAYLGTISYSIYLFGPVAQDLTMRYMPHILGDFSQGYIAIAVLVAIIIAALVYRFVEWPAIEWGRKIIARIEAR